MTHRYDDSASTGLPTATAKTGTGSTSSSRAIASSSGSGSGGGDVGGVAHAAVAALLRQLFSEKKHRPQHQQPNQTPTAGDEGKQKGQVPPQPPAASNVAAVIVAEWSTKTTNGDNTDDDPVLKNDNTNTAPATYTNTGNRTRHCGANVLRPVAAGFGCRSVGHRKVLEEAAARDDNDNNTHNNSNNNDLNDNNPIDDRRFSSSTHSPSTKLLNGASPHRHLTHNHHNVACVLAHCVFDQHAESLCRRALLVRILREMHAIVDRLLVMKLQQQQQVHDDKSHDKTGIEKDREDALAAEIEAAVARVRRCPHIQQQFMILPCAFVNAVQSTHRRNRRRVQIVFEPNPLCTGLHLWVSQPPCGDGSILHQPPPPPPGEEQQQDQPLLRPPNTTQQQKHPNGQRYAGTGAHVIAPPGMTTTLPAAAADSNSNRNVDNIGNMNAINTECSGRSLVSTSSTTAVCAALLLDRAEGRIMPHYPPTLTAPTVPSSSATCSTTTFSDPRPSDERDAYPYGPTAVGFWRSKPGAGTRTLSLCCTDKIRRWCWQPQPQEEEQQQQQQKEQWYYYRGGLQHSTQSWALSTLYSHNMDSNKSDSSRSTSNCGSGDSDCKGSTTRSAPTTREEERQEEEDVSPPSHLLPSAVLSRLWAQLLPAPLGLSSVVVDGYFAENTNSSINNSNNHSHGGDGDDSSNAANRNSCGTDLQFDGAANAALEAALWRGLNGPKRRAYDGENDTDGHDDRATKENGDHEATRLTATEHTSHLIHSNSNNNKDDFRGGGSNGEIAVAVYCHPHQYHSNTPLSSSSSSPLALTAWHAAPTTKSSGTGTGNGNSCATAAGVGCCVSPLWLHFLQSASPLGQPSHSLIATTAAPPPQPCVTTTRRSHHHPKPPNTNPTTTVFPQIADSPPITHSHEQVVVPPHWSSSVAVLSTKTGYAAGLTGQSITKLQQAHVALQKHADVAAGAHRVETTTTTSTKQQQQQSSTIVDGVDSSKGTTTTGTGPPKRHQHLLQKRPRSPSSPNFMRENDDDRLSLPSCPPLFEVEAAHRHADPDKVVQVTTAARHLHIILDNDRDHSVSDDEKLMISDDSPLVTVGSDAYFIRELRKVQRRLDELLLFDKE